MAIEQFVGVGVGLAAGEAFTQAYQHGTIDRGTTSTALIGVTSGMFGPFVLNAVADREVFPDRGAKFMLTTGLSMYGWMAARFRGVAPKIVLDPPDSVNLADAVLTGAVTGLATAGIVMLWPATDRVL